MSKIKNLKSQVAAVLLVQGIIFGGTAVAPALAKHHVAEADSQVVSTTAPQKLALASEGSALQQASQTVTSKSFKAAKSEKTSTFDVEHYNFDMAGNLPGAGI